MRTNKFLALAALATLMASCSNEDHFSSEENLKDTPMTFTVGVGDMATRAGYDNSNLPPYFFVNIDQEGTEYDYAWVRMNKNDDNTYSPTEGTTLLWGSSTRNAKIEAYCGYDIHWNCYPDRFSGYYTLTSGSLSDLLENDYLGACSAVSDDIVINGGSVAVNFRHLLSKLDVTYSWGDELTDVAGKSISRVSYEGFGNKFTINLATAEVAPYMDADGYNYTTFYSYLNGMTSECIFAPFVSNPKLRITATVDGASREFAVNVPVPAAGFQQGCRYTLNVCIGGKSATAGTLSIAEGWEDTSISHGGFDIQ